MYSTYRRALSTCFLGLLAMLALVASGATTSIVFANPDDSCAEVENESNPPIDEPEPDIGGTVTDVDTSTSVSGATVRLYRCSSGTAVLVTSTTTDSSGDFLFQSVSPGKFYVVAVSEAGVLAGHIPAAGTENPSDAISVGPSAMSVDFDFEE